MKTTQKKPALVNLSKNIPTITGLAAVTSAAIGTADAAIVQITLTGNQITAQGGNALNADFTGDAVDDVTFTNAFVHYNSVAFGADGAGMQINGGGFNQGNFRDSLLSGFSRVAYQSVNGVGNTPDGLIAISWNDANTGGAVNAWLDVHTQAIDQSPTNGVYLQRVIWDDAAPGTRPTGITATDAAYTEFTSVPEPSSLALLALGAGGLIARRRRQAAA